MLSMEPMYVKVSKAEVPQSMVTLSSQCDIIAMHTMSIHVGQPSIWCLVTEEVEIAPRRLLHTHSCRDLYEVNIIVSRKK
jgi:hypothetical protein